MTDTMITLKDQIDDTSGGHTGSGQRVDVVPRRAQVDANTTARQHNEILHGQFGEGIDVHLRDDAWVQCQRASLLLTSEWIVIFLTIDDFTDSKSFKPLPERLLSTMSYIQSCFKVS